MSNSTRLGPKAGAALAVLALFGLAAPAEAALNAYRNALTVNGLMNNALVSNALTSNALSQNAIVLNGAALAELNGVTVEAVVIPSAQ
jgi:hypothetical protein